jgi:hypothetical protein
MSIKGKTIMNLYNEVIAILREQDMAEVDTENHKRWKAGGGGGCGWRTEQKDLQENNIENIIFHFCLTVF